MANSTFKTPVRVSATLPIDYILEKVKQAIEEDKVPIVISDWNLTADWNEQLFSLEGISEHFKKYTQDENSKFFVN